MAWLNENWQYRRKFTSDNTKVAASYPWAMILDLSQFPADFFTKIKSGGEDIRITKADGETEVARGVREVDTGENEGLVYFHADGISTSADTDFYIYYGNAAASDHADNAAMGMENVFSSDYKFYSTMADLTTSSLKNETSNDNDASKGADNQPNEVAGQVGKAQDFGGTDNQWNGILASNIGISGNAVFTIAAWLKPTTTNSILAVLGWGDHTTSGAVASLCLNVAAGSSGFDQGDGNVSLETAGGRGARTATGAFTANVWNHIVIIKAAGALHTTTTIYVNGSSVALSTSSDTTPNITNERPALGRFTRQATGGSALWFAGEQDEVSILSGNLTADEVAAIYNNQSNNATFWTVGGEESEGGGNGGEDTVLRSNNRLSGNILRGEQPYLRS